MDLADVEFILYVRDQAASREFYVSVLDRPPTLDVPGMTEFSLGPGCVLGIMPEAGIARVLGLDAGRWSGPDLVPRCELYLRAADADAAVRRAVLAGARVVSPMARRDWGDEVAYLADPDGHILALVRTGA